jgi:hypothetical protein
MQFVGRNNLPAMKNPMPTSRSATTRIPNVTRKSRRSKLVAAPLVGAVIAVGALSGCAATSNSVDQPAKQGGNGGGGGAGAASESLLSDWAGKAVTAGLESAFGAIGSEIGTGLGQAALGYLGLGGNDISLGDIDAELKETNKKLDTIDADLKVQTAAIQGLNCDVNVGNMNADRSTIASSWNFFQSYVRQSMPDTKKKIQPGLKQQIADWADKALAQDDNGLGKALDSYSELVRRDDGQNSGALKSCIAAQTNSWQTQANDKVLPVSKFYSQINQILSYFYNYQTQGMVALANATQVNATETLSELTTKDGAPLKLTNEMFGLAPTTGDVTTNTTTPCGVLESLDQDSFNSEMWDKVLGARAVCDRSYNSESGALTTTHQELVKQMQTAGIPLSELAVPSYLPNPPAGKEKVPAYVQLAGGKAPGAVYAASLEAAVPYFQGEDCRTNGVLPAWPACGGFTARGGDGYNPAVIATPTTENPYNIVKSGASWKGADASSWNTMLDNSDFDEKQTTKKMEALGFEVPGRKVYQPTSDGKPESFNIQVVRSTSNPNEPLTCTKDQASASLVDTSTVGRITSYDQVARAMSKDPVDASVKADLVALPLYATPDVFTYSPYKNLCMIPFQGDIHLAVPAWVNGVDSLYPTPGYQLLSLADDDMDSASVETNPITGYKTLAGSFRDRLIPERLPAISPPVKPTPLQSASSSPTPTGGPLKVVPAALPGFCGGKQYLQKLNPQGGTPPYAFSTNNMRVGDLQLNSEGTISGVQPYNSVLSGLNVTVTLKDGAGASTNQDVWIPQLPQGC